MHSYSPGGSTPPLPTTIPKRGERNRFHNTEFFSLSSVKIARNTQGKDR